MAGWNEEMVVGLVATPWQPLSVRERPRELLAGALAPGVLGTVAVLHLVRDAGPAHPARSRKPPVEDAILVDFVDARHGRVRGAARKPQRSGCRRR
jgi:hypothetical protein